MDIPENHIAVFVDTLQFIIVLDSVFIGEYQGSCFEADSMFFDVTVIFVLVPFDGNILNYGFHTLSMI